MFKIKEGTVRNLNKKLVTGALITTLVMSSLTGCASTKDFEYERLDNAGRQVVEITGTMESEIANDLKVIELKVFDEDYLFLARRYDMGTNVNGKWAYTYEYWDVFEDYQIISLTGLVGVDPVQIDTSKENFKLVKETSLNEYLIYYGYKQKEYTPDELKEIFYKIKSEYIFKEEKQLVKEK